MPRLGVCSWSLRPSGPSDLVDKLGMTGLNAVQLALDPIREGAWGRAETQRALSGAGVLVLSGMMGTKGEDYSTLDTIRRTGGVRPDEHWEHNLAAARDTAQLAAEMGLRLVTFHAGFIPHERSEPLRAVMLDRLRRIADRFHANGVRIGFETGQEAASTLAEALTELDHPAIGVNFDPANMILYGMGDPVAAVATLRRWIVQVHVKDANPPPAPGEWGFEVPAGAGSVRWSPFFRAVQSLPSNVDLLIERESGDARIADVRTAAALVRAHSAAPTEARP
ncbi:MAG: sugar phosphate isomerase/epimerase [Phycisphaerae bacterium]|nr:sugar phosphate isomerase/epimerase [Phycisphaerae bacterium]